MKKYQSICIKFSALTLVLLSSSLMVKAQLDPLAASYYQNQYLANPAMAGLQEGLNANVSFRKLWSSIPGSPVTQALTAEYGFGKKAGIGINILNEKAGLQKNMRAVATYAYHLPLNNEGSKLNMGVSLGFSNQRLDMQNINGNSGDVDVLQYNQRDTYVDGDFGAAFTSNKLTVQGSIPNLKSFFNKDRDQGTVDRSTFFAAAAYKFQFGIGQEGIGLEPKVAYRGIKGMDNILDAGANLSFINNTLNLMAIYHSTRSTTFGVGMRYQNINISGMYTNETAAIRGNTSGTFDINFGILLF